MICPHCHKDTDTPTTDHKPKRTRVRANVTFEKQPFPGKGEAWSWHTCYFVIGDEIKWIPNCDRLKGDRPVKRGEVYVDKVYTVKMNQYGRISYYNEYHDLILMEEVRNAHTLQS